MTLAPRSSDIRLTMDPLQILNDTFGYACFRPGQEEIVRTVMDGENLLAIMPTGAGKSICYQVPALARDGLTVVVSPLIALMRDQVAALRNNGVEAGALNSSIGDEERRRIASGVREGTLKLLYVSPERLAHGNTIEWLARSNVRLMAIDEAHCVSQWGHDFRPEYAAIGEARRRLDGVQTVAFTATADVATREDIVGRLFEAPPRLFVHGFDRPNLRLAFAAKDNSRRQLLSFLDKHKGESGIVYCSSRNATEKLATMLEGEGFRALAYHAGLDQAERDRNQDVFLQEDGVVVVATVAFGMGIDKPDVRFVAHAAMPKSIEAYYQEIGRAGRDGLPADTLTLYGMEDMRLRRLQIEDSGMSDEQKRVERQRLNALVSLCEAPVCRRQTLLAYFAEESEPCGHCDLCQEGAISFDGTIEAQKVLSAVLRTGERFGAEHIVNVLVGETTDMVRRCNHDGLKTFGCGADRGKPEWRSLIRQVVALGLASVDVSGYGGLSVTEKGWAALKGAQPVRLRSDVLRPRLGRRRRGATPEEGTRVDADDPLLGALKALRTRLAKEAAVPAYVIFTDRTLHEIAAARPSTPDALAEIHGVGRAKIERYGEAFLEVVAEHAGA